MWTLRHRLGGRVALLHLLWRARPQEARYAVARGIGRNAEGGNLRQLPWLSQIDRQSAGFSAPRAAATGSGDGRAGSGSAGARLSSAAAISLSTDYTAV